MRSFSIKLFKNIILIYLCALICFIYTSMMDAIPEHVYMEEGSTLSLSRKIPVEVAACENHSIYSSKDIGSSTYESLLARKKADGKETLTIGQHKMICYLFGIFPIKEVEVSVIKSTNLRPSGHVVGIYGITNGVFVLGSSPVELADGTFRQPAEHVLFPGDYILAVNHHAVTSKEDLTVLIQKNETVSMVLTILRGNEQIDVSVTPVLAKTGENNKLNYMLGIWVRDDMAGIGTMTYYDDNGNYGALGHGIGDGETGELLKLDKGYLYEADILGIKRGQRGDPGELEGVISYRKTSMLGTVRQNSDIGIYGKLNDEYINEIKDKNKPYLLGFKQDLKTGEAYIISDVSGERQAYHIMMDSFDYSPSDRNKGIHFYVDDERLLSLTGGIVQGMSGSPIIQDGRIVGAVTHVLIQDSSRGYGIFIDEMLSQK